MDLGVSGLASGFDWRTLVDQLAQAERSPQTRMRTEQNRIQQRNNAYTSIKTQLNVLKSRIATLQDTDLYDSRAAKVSDSALALATAGAGAPVGAYKFNVTRLATSSVQRGVSDVGAAVSSTNDVSALTLGNAGFNVAVTAGSITVNGKQITLATSDTLQGVFDKITAATSGVVTGSYDAASDRIQLASSGEIVLGSAADSSNFLQVAKLSNNGTSSVASSSKLGGVKLASSLATANFGTPVADGGSGKFKINGVEISFTATTDTVSDVIKRINDSSAGVTASYDSVNDRFLLTNETTGDLGVSMEDVSGNFLAATGLTSGSLQRGRDLEYTINDGDTLYSHSNTIEAASSGIESLSVSILKEGTVTVDVSSDTSKVRSAITSFVDELNRTQSLIDSQTSSTTDSNGKVTAAALAGERDAAELARSLRSMVFSDITGISGAFKRIASLGYETNGNDNTLSLSDSTTLDAALSANLNDVRELFTSTTSGITTQFSSFFDKTIGDEGSLVQKQTQLSKEVSTIDTDISAQERYVQQTRTRLINSFVAMERAQASSNQQLQFLAKRFA